MSITPNDMPGAPAIQAEAPVPAPEPTPAAAAPATAEPAAKPNKDKDKGSPPPWGSDDDFQPDKAWKLIQNLRAEAADYKAKAQPVLEEHERLRRASQTELDRAREDLNAIAAREQAWRTKAVSAEAKSLADRFIDADAAIALVGDLSEFASDDGVNSEALNSRFDQLAADKPHLLKAPPGFTPNRAQSQSGTGHQIPIDAQINAAQERGDLITSIALKQAKRYAQ